MKKVIITLFISLLGISLSACDNTKEPPVYQEPKEYSKIDGYVYDLESINDYELVWSDEFDYEGLPDDTKWGYDTGDHGWGNNELQNYTDDKNAFVNDGILTIEAIKDDAGKWTSARLVTRQKGDWKWGKIEVRAKLPTGRDRKSTRLNSSHVRISYAVFCLK